MIDVCDVRAVQAMPLIVECAYRIELLHVYSVKHEDRTPFDVTLLEAIVSAFKMQECSM